MARRGRTARAQLAFERGWHYARRGSRPGFGAVEDRWRAAGAAVADLDPADELTGAVEPAGRLFTLFDTTVLGSSAGYRTVSVLHLPVALPPVAVIPDPANGEPSAEGRVGPVPPWAALAFQHPPELDGAPPARHPAFADALVTGEVLDVTRRYGLLGWRIAGRDLVWVSRPGDRLAPDRIVALLPALAALAAVLPPSVVRVYGVDRD
ncbi:hypothetical protein [Dactylosporangium sp. NPDC049140]|uniref:hypothetical protein n=1 Tax=Dactylosporangium sp. NPDC049140 TaxID=3155647 RepID=UPI0033FF831E